MSFTCLKSCFTTSKKAWKELEELAERVEHFERKLEKLAKDVDAAVDSTTGATTLDDLGKKFDVIEKDVASAAKC